MRATTAKRYPAYPTMEDIHRMAEKIVNFLLVAAIGGGTAAMVLLLLVL